MSHYNQDAATDYQQTDKSDWFFMALFNTKLYGFPWKLTL
jgi:hypothetical protein